MSYFHFKKQKWINSRYLLLLFFSLFALATPVELKAQNQALSLSLNKVSLREFFDAIENQSQYKFAYRDLILDSEKDISISVVGKPIGEVLNQVLPGKSLQYGIQGSVINITQSNATSQSGKNTIKVSGRVLDDLGEPVIGGSVVQKGSSSNGTITDLEGNFSLEIPAGSAVTVNYLGYSPEEITVNSEKPVIISLKENTQKLNEVVVIGYGTRQRKTITGAVDQVGAEMIEGRPVANMTQALQGTSANLTIQQKSMNPNDNATNINIRGVSTMNNNDPLLVIDGVITEIGSLNQLNPADIENVSILKDAGSAAIYGSRSSNGVILVTTKKGTKNSKPTLRVNTMLGTQNPDVLYSPVKGYENAILKNQSLINSGSAPIYSPEQIRDLQQHGDGQWFLDGILQNALQQTYNASISGGNQTSTYMASAGYYNQESNFVGNYGMERYNFRVNLVNEYNRLKLSTIMSYNRTMQKAPTASTGTLIADGGRIPPYYYSSMQAPNGHYLTNDVLSEFNPLGILEAGGSEKRDEDNINGSFNAEFKITEGLKAKGLVGLDLNANHRYIRRLEVPFYPSATAEIPSSYANRERNTEDYNEKKYILNTQFMLDYDRAFNTVHQVTGLIGVSNETYNRQANEIKKKYTDPDLGLPGTETIIDPSSYNTPKQTQQRSIYSLFGRAGYSYSDKYYGEFSFRYDGSSKFAEDFRWGFFPSASAGWRMSEESFMSTYKEKVGDLKFRTSYGILGNQNVDDYSYFTTYTPYDNSYGFNNSGVSGTGFTFGNPYLQWEESANFNIGLDASFIQNKLFVSFDYFNKVTSQILITPEVPTAFGGAVAKENAGEMRNQGWEATVSYRTKSGEFSHNMSFNIADSRNEVTDFGGQEQISGSEEMLRIIREGESFNSYYGYKTDGFFQSYEEIGNSALPVGTTVAPGDVKYVDTNGDGVIDDEDRQVLGNAFPRYTFGFTYQVGWKGFDMSMLIQGVGQRQMFVRGELVEPFHSNYSYTMYEHQLDYWTPTNTDAQWPALSAPGSASNRNNFGRSSDTYIFNASYLRLKDIQIGYTLPKTLTAKLGVQKLRVNINAQNLFTISNVPFIDPESTEFGNNMGGTGGVGSNSGRNYPTPRYFGFGLDMEF